MRPSKELLSEVLGIDTISDYEFDSNLITIYYIDDEDRRDYGLINIHELAHKCKEWALKKGYWLSSWHENRKSFCYVDEFIKIPATCVTQTIDADTEPEAIFKACEWILEQRDKS